MKAVLFDMDGVLVDVSSSYRITIQRVVEFFSGESISPERIQYYKNCGGLNNDWDLCEYILVERGVEVARHEVVEKFQAIYVGDHFNGLITREKWLLNRRHLTWISERFKTGIVTGRPAAEARFTLNHFKMSIFFPVVITMEDVPPGRGKPDPLGLALAMEGLAAREGYYVGDTVDDMEASQRAGLLPIGISNSPADIEKQEDLLLSKGAIKVFNRADKILEVLT